MIPITIIMTVWFVDEQRKQLAEDTLKSWSDYLFYEGDINLHVADDGSTLPWKVKTAYQLGFPARRRMHITYSRQERHGVGASLNAGFKKAFETSPIVLYMVDDWQLTERFDITPWVQLLEEREDVGIVRLGPPHPYLRGEIMPYTSNWQGWAMKLDRYGLTVGDRPMLVHKRWTDYYGWRTEDINAQECERLASVKYAEFPNGPDIVYALPHPWFHYHLDTVPSTSHIEPEKE